MNDALLGFLFIFCLVIGAGLGIVFQSFEIGGVIGLGSGLIVLILFRNKGNRKL